jgi:hypothetical protein
MMKKSVIKKSTVSRAPSKMPKGAQIMPKISGTKPGVKQNMPKIQGTKPGVKTPMVKKLTGAAAIAELQRQVSPKGVKKAEVNAKKAIDKKYPGLYKSGK